MELRAVQERPIAPQSKGNQLRVCDQRRQTPGDGEQEEDCRHTIKDLGEALEYHGLRCPCSSERNPCM
ncbi:hypothetical protein NDU88_006129, partial [Pleurodeles waltl]